MERESIIVHNDTGMAMGRCLVYVQSIIERGRISDYGKSYCFVTHFRDGVLVSATRNKNSDTFVVWREDEQDG
jgi:hypothetical protein